MNSPDKKSMTNSLKNNDSKNDADRRICFDSNPVILTVDSHFDYTANERSSAWYTSSECHCFKAQYDRESSDKSIDSIDFERAQRIDAVRDLLLKAQEVQKSIRDSSNKSTSSEESGTKCNAKWGSYSRWLADFYKHHSEDCGIAARHRGLENFIMANQKWCTKNHPDHHHVEHSDSDSESETEVAGKLRPSLAKKCPSVKNSPVKHSPVKPRRWNDNNGNDNEDDNSSSRKSQDSDDSLPSPKSKLRQGRWSANESSGNGSSGKSSRDVPLKPLKHNMTPPKLYNAHAA